MRSPPRLIHRYKHASILVESYKPCTPLDAREYRLYTQYLDYPEIKEYLNTHPYDYKFLIEFSCLVSGFKLDQGIKSNLFIQEILSNLKMIGSESVYGYALSGRLVDANDLYVIKVSQSSDVEMQYHEAMIALYGTNQLRKQIPNFVYLYGTFRCSPPVLDQDKVIAFCTNQSKDAVPYLFYEKINDSMDLLDFVRSHDFKEFLEAFLQILFALQIAYEQIGFTHHDLHMHNVLIKYLEEPRSIRYTWNHQDYYITSRYLAVIIDFGMSRMVYQDRVVWYSEFNEPVFAYGFPIADAYKLLMLYMSQNYHQNKVDYHRLEFLVRDLFHWRISSEVTALLSQPESYNSFMLEPTEELLKVQPIHWIKEIDLKGLSAGILTLAPQARLFQCDNDCQIMRNFATEIQPSDSLEIYDFYLVSRDQQKTREFINQLTQEEIAEDVFKVDVKLQSYFTGLSEVLQMRLEGEEDIYILTNDFMEKYENYVNMVAKLYQQADDLHLRIPPVYDVATHRQLYPLQQELVNKANNYNKTLPLLRQMSQGILADIDFIEESSTSNIYYSYDYLDRLSKLWYLEVFPTYQSTLETPLPEILL